MRNALGLLKLIAQSEEEIKKGKTKAHADVFANLKKKLKASE